MRFNMKRHIKEDASAPALNVSTVGGTKLSSSGQRLQDRLAKIPGLDKLMQNVSRRDDAAAAAPLLVFWGTWGATATGVWQRLGCFRGASSALGQRLAH